MAEAARASKAFELPPLVGDRSAYNHSPSYWDVNGAPYAHHLQHVRANSPFATASNGGSENGAAGSPSPYGRLPPPADLLRPQNQNQQQQLQQQQQQQQHQQQQQQQQQRSASGSAPTHLPHLGSVPSSTGLPKLASQLQPGQLTLGDLEQWRADLLVGKDWLEGMLNRTSSGLQMVEEQLKRHAPPVPVAAPPALVPAPVAAPAPPPAPVAPSPANVSGTATPTSTGSPAVQYPASTGGDSDKAQPLNLKRNPSSKKVWTVEEIHHGNIGNLNNSGSLHKH